jgi:hypothetical protein
MFFVSEIVAHPTTRSLQRLRAINEKHCFRNVVLLADLSEKRLRSHLFLIGSSVVCSNSFVAASTVAYSQYCSSLSWITVSSTAT